MADEVTVDLMFNACGETFESLSEYIQVIETDGVPIQTLTLDGLLKTKQTARGKDETDRIILEKAIERKKSSGT